MQWHNLTDIGQLEIIEGVSEKETVFIFKHSTRCSISSMAKSRLERLDGLKQSIYYLDLIKYREISNLIADRYKVQHESPQLLVLKNKQVIEALSHSDIAEHNLNGL